MRGALEPRLGLQRRVERLDDALRPRVRALEHAGDVQLLVRKRAARGQVDARNLEQRDPLVPDLGVPASGVDEAREQARPQQRQLDRDRLGQAKRVLVEVVRPERRRVRLAEPEPDEHVLDAAA